MTAAPRTSGALAGKGSADRSGSGSVRYDHGPTKRVAAPRTLAPAKPSPPGLDRSSGKGAGPRSANKPLAPASRTVKNWREVRRSDPKGAREIFVATKLAGRAHEIAVGVATGAFGGVSPGGYRGGLDLDDSWVCNPWGWDRWSCGGFAWWGSFGSWCWWWSYPWYWSWYYPCWWWYSRPYYTIDYCYYPVTRVVYSSPQVVYVEQEPVGEAALPAQPPETTDRIASPAAESPLSIAAQRYLELGDRAFREGRYIDAVQFYAKAVEFAPDQGALYLVLSDALFAAGDYHYGAYAVRRALELDPALVDSQVDKHGFYPDPRQFDEQIAALERYLNDHPGDRDAALILSLNYLFGGRARDAVGLLESPASALADDQAAQRILARAREALRS